MANVNLHDISVKTVRLLRAVHAFAAPIESVAHHLTDGGLWPQLDEFREAIADAERIDFPRPDPFARVATARVGPLVRTSGHLAAHDFAFWVWSSLVVESESPIGQEDGISVYGEDQQFAEVKRTDEVLRQIRDVLPKLLAGVDWQEVFARVALERVQPPRVAISQKAEWILRVIYDAHPNKILKKDIGGRLIRRKQALDPDTIAVYLEELSDKRLAHLPDGPRSGWAMTSDGVQLISELPPVI